MGPHASTRSTGSSCRSRAAPSPTPSNTWPTTMLVSQHSSQCPCGGCYHRVANLVSKLYGVHVDAPLDCLLDSRWCLDLKTRFSTLVACAVLHTLTGASQKLDLPHTHLPRPVLLAALARAWKARARVQRGGRCCPFKTKRECGLRVADVVLANARPLALFFFFAWTEQAPHGTRTFASALPAPRSRPPARQQPRRPPGSTGAGRARCTAALRIRPRRARRARTTCVACFAPACSTRQWFPFRFFLQLYMLNCT